MPILLINLREKALPSAPAFTQFLSVNELLAETYQSLAKLIRYRNLLIHYKSQYKNVQKEKSRTISYTEYSLPRKFVHDLPKTLEKLIQELCEGNNLHIPPWANPKTEWLFEGK